MTYLEWFNDFAQKHKAIVERLLQKGFDKEKIIDYFDFENMCIEEPAFCPLYVDKKKCHEMEKLNCYLCACPNFRFNDEGIEKVDEKTKYSFCSIDSKEGKVGVYGEAIHQDCSACKVPHHRDYVEKHFALDWRKIMLSCIK